MTRILHRSVHPTAQGFLQSQPHCIFDCTPPHPPQQFAELSIAPCQALNSLHEVSSVLNQQVLKQACGQTRALEVIFSESKDPLNRFPALFGVGSNKVVEMIDAVEVLLPNPPNVLG